MSTKLIRSIYNISPKHQGAVVTIGNFDGVHLGHQQLLRRVIKQARQLHKPAMVVTFEPHPIEYFAPEDRIPARLTRLREKFKYLSQFDCDYVLVLPFNQSLARLTASEFLSTILLEKLQTTSIIIGDDFHFGYQRQGNLKFLQQQAGRFGYRVEALQTFEYLGHRVSSSRIRQHLSAGELDAAKALLGRPYTMQGRVRGGDQLGRQWGFPTANIFLHRKVTPLMGIFTVRVHGIGKKALPGVANLGIRPTIHGTRTLLEVHLLDFDQDIYGRYVEVEFCKKLREEIYYPDVASLIKQIALDVEQARAYFKNGDL